jgi:hypothetical protein
MYAFATYDGVQQKGVFLDTNSDSLSMGHVHVLYSTAWHERCRTRPLSSQRDFPCVLYVAKVTSIEKYLSYSR